MSRFGHSTIEQLPNPLKEDAVMVDTNNANAATGLEHLEAAGIQVFITRLAHFCGMTVAKNDHVRAFARSLFSSEVVGNIPGELLKDGLLLLASLTETPGILLRFSSVIPALKPEMIDDFWKDGVRQAALSFIDEATKAREAKGAPLTEADYEQVGNVAFEKIKDTPTMVSLKESLQQARFILDGGVPHLITCGTVLLKVTTIEVKPKKGKNGQSIDPAAVPTTKKVFPPGMRELSVAQALAEKIDVSYRPICCGGVKHLFDDVSNADSEAKRAATSGPLSLLDCLVDLRDTLTNDRERGLITRLIDLSFSDAEANEEFARVNFAPVWNQAKVRQFLLMSSSEDSVNLGRFVNLLKRAVPKPVVPPEPTPVKFSDSGFVRGVKAFFGFFRDLFQGLGTAKVLRDETRKSNQAWKLSVKQQGDSKRADLAALAREAYRN